MSKSLNLAKVSTKSGFNLFWGQAVSSIISAVGVMIIAGILEEGEYGLMGIALTAPSLIQIIRDLGVDQATIKYTAQYNQWAKSSKIKNVLTAAITFEFLFGIILSILSYVISGYVATQIFDRPQLISIIQIASFTIFGNALITISNSAFIGYEKMQYRSILIVIQSLFKSILMIILVLSNFGVHGAILGQTIGCLITGFVGITILYFRFYKKIHTKTDKHEIIPTLKQMLKFGLPLSGARIMNGFKIQVFGFLIAIYLSDQIVGNYNLATNFSLLVAFFVTPIQILLFPAFSKIDKKSDPKILQNVFRYSIKYASLFVVPATFMVMALSQPAVGTLFPGKYELTPLYLSLNVILYLYTAFGYLSSGNLIKSQGRTDINLKLGFLSTILGIILSLILIPIFGVIGLMLTILIAILPATIISLWWIKKHHHATIDFKSSVKILTASSISAVLTYSLVFVLNSSNWITLTIGAIVFLASYIVIAPLIRAINKDDVKNLKEMFQTLGRLAIIIDIPLNIIEKIATKRQPNK